MLPRVTAQRTRTPVAWLRSRSGYNDISGVVVSTSRDRGNTGDRVTFLRSGLVMGKNSNDSKWEPIRGSQLSAAEAAAQTELSVDSNVPFTTNGTTADTGANVWIMSADGTQLQNLGAIVSVGTGTITVTNALDLAYAIDSHVFVAPATLDYGRHIACGILAADVDILDPDDPGTAIDMDAPICFSGWVDSAVLLGITDKAIAELRDGSAGNQAHNFVI